MQCFLNIKVSQTATASEPSANTLLIKLNTTAQDNRGNNGSVRDKIQRTRNIFYILENIKHARNNNNSELTSKHKERTTISTTIYYPHKK